MSEKVIFFFIELYMFIIIQKVKQLDENKLYNQLKFI